MFEEKVLTCKDCGAEFVFSASEQEFYAEKGFTNEPGRCPSCRAARKQQTRGNSGGYQRQERQMYPAVCASCGVDKWYLSSPVATNRYIAAIASRHAAVTKI